MKNYEIEYRDCTSMRCGVEIEALSEKEAIINLQKELIEDGDYMTQLLTTEEVINNKNKQYDIKRTNRSTRLEGYYN